VAAQDCIDALHRSHEHLSSIVDALSEEEYTSPSYDTEWTIAQVLSHLGSQSEIFPLMLDAGLNGTAAPGPAQFQPIWDRWNAKSPKDQVADYTAATGAALGQLDALSEEERSAFSIEMFGMTLDLSALLRMRLNEHSLHTWDVDVARDSSARVDAEAAALVFDLALQLAERVGRPQEGSAPVGLHVLDLSRAYELELDPKVRFVPVGIRGESGRTATMEAESVLRLIAGRLDAEHLPATVELGGVTLVELRQVFQGY
jgi:uncharacterized protein (TIGR03083 family)